MKRIGDVLEQGMKMVSESRRGFLWSVVMDIYRQMFRKSRPPADFDKLVAKQETLKADWYMGYFLPVDRQEDIIRAVAKSYGLSARELHIVAKEVHLGSSPNSSFEAWKDYRKVKKVGK